MDPHHAATWRHPLVIAALDAIMARYYGMPESRAAIATWRHPLVIAALDAIMARYYGMPESRAAIADRLDMQLTPDGWTVGDFLAGRPMRHSCGECGLVHEAPAVP